LYCGQAVRYTHFLLQRVIVSCRSKCAILYSNLRKISLQIMIAGDSQQLRISWWSDEGLMTGLVAINSLLHLLCYLQF